MSGAELDELDRLSDLAVPVPVTEVLSNNYIPYAMTVIISRALPEIDGFKPVHRRIMYAMYKMGMLKGGLQKSSRVVGEVMGKYHPHGDAAIYEAMVRVTKDNESLIHPLIDSKGNFGKRYSSDITYAAPRYTEVALPPISKELFKDLDKGIVDMKPSYDESREEPTLLPVSFPNILITPNMGVAVSMASSIPSFNMIEVCEATIALLKSSKADVYEYIKAPDFSSGGRILFDEEKAREVLSRGTGSFTMQAVMENDKKNRTLSITEIPYTTTYEQIRNAIVEHIKEGKFKEISNVHDGTGRQGFRMDIEYKRGTDTDKLMNDLYALTPLMSNFSCNFNIITEGRPRVMGITDILKLWIEFRQETLTRYFEHQRAKVEKDIAIAEGMLAVSLDIDKAIKVIRETKEDKKVVPNMQKAFSLTELQAEAVCNIRLRNLNKEYLLKAAQHLDKLRKELLEIDKRLGSTRSLNQYIITDLLRVIKEYGQERKTVLVSAEKNEVTAPTENIDDSQVVIYITEEGYVKKVSLSSAGSKTANNRIKDGDRVVLETELNNATTDILVFTDKLNVYKVPLHQVAQVTMRDMGEYMGALAKLDDGEVITHVTYTENYEGHIYFAFENGNVAKVPLKSYYTKQNRRRLANSVSGRSPLIGVQVDNGTDKDFYMYLGSTEKELVFEGTTLEAVNSRNAAGVRVMRLAKKDQLTEFRVKADEDDAVFTARTIPSAGRVKK